MPFTENEEKENLRENDQKKDERLNTLRSCSGCLIDKRLLAFFTTLFISVSIIIFCIYKLYYSEECNSKNTWLGLLMFILGVWVKSPTL